MGVVTNLLVVDVIPSSDSSETYDNSEPSVAVDPLKIEWSIFTVYAPMESLSR